jgi:hypothetical protein
MEHSITARRIRLAEGLFEGRTPRCARRFISRAAGADRRMANSEIRDPYQAPCLAAVAERSPSMR